MNRSVIAIFLISAIILLSGCSGQPNQPASPGTVATSVNDAQNPGRILLSAGILTFDTVALTATFTPDRNALAHWNGTPYVTPPICDDCITIDVLEFNPVEKYVKLDITLRNPTDLTVRDVRGIAMSNAEGLKLINAYSYTDLWDDGGDISINPFIYYGGFGPSYNIATETFEIEYPNFAELLNTQLVIDASWPGKCKEPFKVIFLPAYENITFVGYHQKRIHCYVESWNDDVESVTIDLSCLGLDANTPMLYASPNSWYIEDISWHDNGYEPGTYPALVSAKCEGSPLYLYNYAYITIEPSDSELIWVRTWGGKEPDTGFKIAAGDDGSAYVTGFYEETVDFNPGPGTDEHTGNGDMDAFLSKINSSGDFEWALTWGGSKYDYGMDISTDDVGNVYVIGLVETDSSGIVDLDPGPGLDEHPLEGSADIFLSKFNSSGDFMWGLTWGGEGVEIGYGLAVDGSGNVYATGIFCWTIDLDPGPGIEEHSSNGDYDAFLNKFDANGNFLWGCTWGGAGREMAASIITDASGNVYVTGYFEETVDYDPGDGVDEHISNGERDIYVCKFNTDGDYQWARTIGGVGSDGATGIATDALGNVCFNGTFYETVDFDPGPGVETQISLGYSDIFLCSYTSSGDFEWVQTWGGDTHEESWDIAIDDSDYLFVVGEFSSDFVDFNPGPDVDEHTSGDGRSGFLSKFDSAGNFQKAITWGVDVSVNGYGVAIGDSNSAYVTGMFSGFVDFDPGPYWGYYSSNGCGDVYLCRFLVE